LNIKTTENPTIVIQSLEDKFLGEVVRIHRAVLGYTLNSQLGDEHLAFIYRHMSKNASGFVGVAFVSGQLVGLVSGTTDMDEMKAILLKSLKPKQFGNIIAHLIKNPSLLMEFYKSSVIGRPVHIDGELITAILTTIAIDPHFQGLGIGKKLVFALENFFRSQNIQNYRLDTLVSNQSARKFYKKLGFQEVQTRADSVVIIKGLKNA
jgi:ribosomal protein S18 acetylase RimI-like enzyme